MPRIFDNIETDLLDGLVGTLKAAHRADFCVGYFNLRGWKGVAPHVDEWKGGEQNRCRLLVGMQCPPQEQLRQLFSVASGDEETDQATALAAKRKLVNEFREQLTFGVPTAADEAALRRLAAQIRAGKLVVKLFLRHPLHAKLYLLFREDAVTPKVGYVGSSNLTLAGLSGQGELNVDVTDQDACTKLEQWFEDRWNDRLCVDISKELVDIIAESWAREEAPPPYHIYVKIAYHLSQEARAGLAEFRLPSDFKGKLFAFQEAAVRIAAHHLNKRGGVVIGDVVGLGKTLMATAVARIFEDDHGLETLIICPKNLVGMWEQYRMDYRLRAKVLSVTRVQEELPNLPRFRLVLIDESHNLRNREGRRYRAISEYINANESRVILLSATPYNKSYLDLSSQLRLFIPEDRDIGARPEKLLRELGETEFIRRHQCTVRSLAAFEKSPHADDWRELMRLYLVRRTRGFIVENYAHDDPERGRKYLEFPDGTRSYFPVREPRTVPFTIDDADPADQYARLYADDVVEAVNGLQLPRYGLGNYVATGNGAAMTGDEAKTLQDLGRAGVRLKGFCRTNLYKRLESDGHAFLLSLDRHILRNHVFLHALENGLPLPIGTQDLAVLDATENERDAELWEDAPDAEETNLERTERGFRERAARIYATYAEQFKPRFKWLNSAFFNAHLAKDLRADADTLLRILADAGPWDPARDTKLDALATLLTQTHPGEKVLIFSQFADTVAYLGRQLQARGVDRIAAVTGDSDDPTAFARRFSPRSNNRDIAPSDELRVLVATDVLSEGQNLQDCAVIVNFDLPWAIIGLIQRAGRVDRIGQRADTIRCYSFLPADGVERVIRLRARVSQRLKENAEVVGADEAFFEDQDTDHGLRDIFTEKAGVFDGEADTEVDLASLAYQIWKNATDTNPALLKTIPALPNVVYSTKAHTPAPDKPEGALVFLRTGEDNDALAWMDRDGASVTESQFAILKAAECAPDTPALPRHPKHHDMVAAGVRLITEAEKSVGGQLGRPSGARFRVYERLKKHVASLKGTLFENNPELNRAIDDIYRSPLLPTATDTLNRQLKAGVTDEDLADLVVGLRRDGRLCRPLGDAAPDEPRVICSLGLRRPPEEDAP